MPSSTSAKPVGWAITTSRSTVPGAADVPALAADGSPINASVPKVLRVRGQQREIGEFALDPAAHVNDHVAQSGLANMPGTPAPELPAAMIDEEDAK